MVKQTGWVEGIWRVCLCGLVLLAACSARHEPGPEPSIPAGAQAYDARSWETLIPSRCRRFSDGCNTCTRSAGAELAACTHRACAVYDKPRCLDESEVPTALENEQSTALENEQSTALENEQPTAVENDQLTVREYECDGGSHFLVFYTQYVNDNQRVELAENQVMFSDRQSQTVSLLTRVPSASGERYQGDGLDYWTKGDTAMVRRNEQPLYRNCVIP